MEPFYAIYFKIQAGIYHIVYRGIPYAAIFIKPAQFSLDMAGMLDYI
jgi:hypothetical protein